MSRETWFIVEIPKSKTDDFLAESVAPAMEAIRDEFRLGGWSFDALELAASPDEKNVFRFHLVLPDDRADAASESVLRERATRIWSGSPAVVRPVPSAPAPNRERFGGEAGMRIQSRFRELDSRLTIAILASSGRPVARKRIALTSIFFFLEASGIPIPQRADWLNIWAKALIAPENDAEWAECFATARGTYRESSAVRELVSALADGEWGALTDPYTTYRESYRELLAMLEQTDYAGSDRYPPYFAAWHSYLHLHLLRMGVDNELESSLLLLAASHYLALNDPS